MKILTLDFETFFSDDYTLKKLTVEEYVRDKRFEVLGCGVRHADGRFEFFRGDECREFFASVDWTTTAVVCHHAHFDLLILSHHYGYVPAFAFCTLSMARLVLGNHVRVGLDSVAKHFGLLGKTLDYSAATGFKGRRAHQLSETLWRDLARGCLHDCAVTWDIFRKMLERFPQEELRVIDMTIRMFTEPKLRGDAEAFHALAREEYERKEAHFESLNVTRKTIRSDGTFRQLLEEQGVEVAMKPSKADPTKQIPAFAKSDQFMRDLVDDENEVVASLVAARLEANSSIDETRAARMGHMAERGPMCVYLNYCGAHTTRWSGGDKLNFQNMKRYDPKTKKGGGLRKALWAQPGHTLIIADKSQIECRLLNVVAGQEDMVETFRQGRDPYLPVASAIYGRPIFKTDEFERFIGKNTELGCGYGLGAVTYKRQLYAKAGVTLPESQCEIAVRSYRDTHPMVVALWRHADGMLDCIGRADPREPVPFWNVEGLTYQKGVVYLPNGAPLHYDLKWQQREEDSRPSWFIRTRLGWTKIWGGHFVENIIQALSRIDVSQSYLRIMDRIALRPVLSTHDEGVWMVPNDRVDDYKGVIEEEFCRAPTWLPNAPIGAEVKVSDNYSK